MNDSIKILIETDLIKVECFGKHARVHRKGAIHSSTYSCAIPENDEEIKEMIENMLFEASIESES